MRKNIRKKFMRLGYFDQVIFAMDNDEVGEQIILETL